MMCSVGCLHSGHWTSTTSSPLSISLHLSFLPSQIDKISHWIPSFKMRNLTNQTHSPYSSWKALYLLGHLSPFSVKTLKATCDKATCDKATRTYLESSGMVTITRNILLSSLYSQHRRHSVIINCIAIIKVQDPHRHTEAAWFLIFFLH